MRLMFVLLIATSGAHAMDGIEVEPASQATIKIPNAYPKGPVYKQIFDEMQKRKEQKAGAQYPNAAKTQFGKQYLAFQKSLNNKSASATIEDLTSNNDKENQHNQ